jgi:hypothetical protein
MRFSFKSLILALLLVFTSTGLAHAAVSAADARYAKEIGKATQDFTDAIGNWGEVYQSAPSNEKSAEFKSWAKEALAADKVIQTALSNFSQIKVSAGYKKSDVTLRKFVKAYQDAVKLFAPAIKKNDKKLVRKANDALLAATAIFSTWGLDFAKDSAKLT